MTAVLKEALVKVKEVLEQRLDIEFNQLRKFEALDFLRKEVGEIISSYRLKLNDDDKKVLQYFRVVVWILLLLL